jgi:mannose-6-phosphate isomerase-like protein (cupin superfamily)
MTENRRHRPVVSSWDAIPAERVRPGVRRRGFGTDDVLLVMNDIEPAMEPNPHVHEDFDQIALIVSGEAVYHIGEVAHRVGPGAVMLIPAGIPHYIEPVGNEAVKNLDVFAPPRKDFSHLIDWMTASELTAP